jgi:hypothetical protein
MAVVEQGIAEDVTSKVCKGRIQLLTFAPHFTLSLQSEEQLKFLHKIPRGQRLGTMDSAGKLFLFLFSIIYF